MDSSQWTTDVQPASPQGPLAHDRERLAVFASHCDIVQAVRASQAVLLCGSAGAGKSTQLAQYIIDDWSAQGLGSECSVVQCASESVVAVCTAERVAAEMQGEGSVGVHTGTTCTVPAPGHSGGRLVFCCRQQLLCRLQFDPFLADVTHIV